MSIRLSTGLRNKVLESGLKPALDGGFINIYPGSQPASPDTGATGTLLGTVSIQGLGATGLTLQVPAVLGVISKTAAEVWSFLGLTTGQAGWFRYFEAGDTPSANSTTAARLDGTIGTAGADIDIGNSNIAEGSSNTMDKFAVTLPAA